MFTHHPEKMLVVDKHPDDIRQYRSIGDIYSPPREDAGSG